MRLHLAILVFLSFLLGARLFFFFSQQTEYKEGETFVYEGILWDQPRQSGRFQVFYLDGLKIKTGEFPKYKYGDAVLVEGTVKENTFISREGEEVTELVVEGPHIEKSEPIMPISWVFQMRQRIITSFVSLLPPDASALFLGVTLGVREEFDRDLYQAFADTGILHVVAASGSNVSILAAVLLPFFMVLAKRKLAVVITGSSLVWYALLAGFDPAIIRACLMALITFSAQVIGRQHLSYFVLFLTAWGMLMVAPGLIENVGFQLSFGATFGILFLKPLLDTFRVIAPLGLIRDDFTTTLAATWGTVPILLWQFGSFSQLGILVNMLVLWTVPIMMVLGLVGAVASLVWSLCALPFALLAYPFLAYFLGVVKLIHPYVLPISIAEFPILIAISYYTLSISIILFLKQKKR